MEAYQTLEKLEERIYTINKQEEIQSSIEGLICEAYKRRRNDAQEDGLQFSGVIYDSRSAFKINERDGLATHPHTQETLAQYLAGDTKFSTEESLRYNKPDVPTYYTNLPQYCIDFRAVMSRNHVTFIFKTRLDEVTEMQKDTIKFMVYLIKIMVQKNRLGSYFISFIGPEKHFLISNEEDIDKAFSDFNNIISNIKSKGRSIQ